jgi:hypothetical protein
MDAGRTPRSPQVASKKLTISIPETLNADLQSIRDRINISGICAAALAREVRIRRAADQFNGALMDTIARMRATRDHLNGSPIETGHRDGVTWALKHASYEDIRVLLHLLKDHSEPLTAALSSSMRADFARGISDSSVSKIAEADLAMYWEGFGEGAHTIWEKIKDAVET